MKYWVFENGDVVGPFPPRELMGREGFGPHSLVCPEEQGEDSSAWKEAAAYEDFHFDEPVAEFAAPVVSDADKKDVFDEELNTLLEEKSPIISPEKDAAPEPAENLHFPAHAPAKPGPIEDYFNNIKGEDLGNILGIPDPNENSDMNLARALKTQFAQTQPPHSEGESSVLEEDPFDAFTAKEDLEDKQSSIEDDLAGLEPAGSAPVVLAGKPQEEPFHPKYRIRKKQEETPQVQADALAPQAPQPVAAPQETQAQSVPAQEEQKPAAHIAQEPQSIPLSAPEPEETVLKEKASSLPAANTQKPVDAVPLSPVKEESAVVQESQPDLPEAQPAPAPQAQKQSAPQAETHLPEETPAPAPLPAAQQTVAQMPKEEPQPLPAQAPEEPARQDAAAALPVLNGEQTPAQPPVEPVVPAPMPEGTAADKEPQAPSVASTPVQAAAPQEQAPASAQKETAGVAQSKVSAQPVQAAPAAQTAAPKQEDLVKEILQGAVDVPETPEIKEPIKEVSPVVEARVNRVKPTLKKTAEIDKFLDEKIKEEKNRSPFSKKIMWALGFLIIILALLGLLWLFGQQTETSAKPQEPAPSVVTEKAAVEELVPDVAVDVPSAQEVLSVPAAPKAPELAPQDQALQIVKNYELPNANGKIADYFDRIYKSKLAQGYNAVWSATPLHNNVYIVKYRVSKTRLEPVVYLFQVDVAKNKLIGALNNITLDLVGKIN